MRVAQRDQIALALWRAVELTPAVRQFLQADGGIAVRLLAAQGGVQRGRFRGDADDMEHGRGAAGGKGCAECFEVVQRGVRVFQSADRRNTGAAQEPQVVAQQRVVGVVRIAWRGYAQNQIGVAVAGQVASGFGGAADQGYADVQVIGVFGGVRAEHAVGINHGVGFGPNDLLTRFGGGFQQVGRAGEAGLRTHINIGLGQRARGLAKGGVNTQGTPAPLVHRNRVQRGRHLDNAAPVAQLFGKTQAGRAGVNTAVNMGLHHINQLSCSLQLRHTEHHLQRDLARFALGTGQDLAVAGAELHGSVHGHGGGGV